MPLNRGKLMTVTALSPQQTKVSIQAHDISGLIAIGHDIQQTQNIYGDVINYHVQAEAATLTRLPGPAKPSLRPFARFRDRVQETQTAVAALAAK
jgi:hypothetical protein